MAIKKYKPISADVRGVSVLPFDEITKTTPEELLTVSLNKSGGRSSYGKVTIRHRGGGAKRKYRIIDFKRNKGGIKAVVKSIEYDPNRTANAALLQYEDGEERCITQPVGLKVGDVVESGADVDIVPGNALPLRNIPIGTTVHNIEVKVGKGAQLVRTAGAEAQLMAKKGKFVQLRLPSGEFRLIHLNCRATVGQVGNISRELVTIGKAGRNRHLSKRPYVRGSVMNLVDHPHGGGEGRTPVGRLAPSTPWGKPALGLKTRKENKRSNKYIVRRRKK